MASGRVPKIINIRFLLRNDNFRFLLSIYEKITNKALPAIKLAGLGVLFQVRIQIVFRT